MIRGSSPRDDLLWSSAAGSRTQIVREIWGSGFHSCSASEGSVLKVQGGRGTWRRGKRSQCDGPNQAT